MIPGMQYHNAPAAIEWLCDAFGFHKHLVVENPDGTIAHSELVLGDAMIMVGSAQGEGEYRTWVQPPAKPGDVVTSGFYVIVDDPDAHYARAQEHGAQILLELKDQSYGGRDYTCRDLGGFVWTFGSYDPWNAPPSEH